MVKPYTNSLEDWKRRERRLDIYFWIMITLVSIFLLCIVIIHAMKEDKDPRVCIDGYRYVIRQNRVYEPIKVKHNYIQCETNDNKNTSGQR